MGRSFRIYLAGEIVFVCRKCQNHLAVGEQVESKVRCPTTSAHVGVSG